MEKEGGEEHPTPRSTPLLPKEENNDEDVTYLSDTTNVHANSND